MITRAASVLALVCLLADQAHAQTAQELKRLTLEEDLHHAHHLEWRDGATSVEIKRSVLVTVTLRR
jgi:hypothetical protein